MFKFPAPSVRVCAVCMRVCVLGACVCAPARAAAAAAAAAPAAAVVVAAGREV